MTSVKFTLKLIILLTLPSSVLSQNKYNLNFENFNSKEQKLSEGWFKWGDFKSVTTEETSSGNYAGKIVSDKNGHFGCITYSIPANYTGDTIRLFGQIKYENVKDYVGLLMRIDGDSENGYLAFDSMQRLKIRGTSDWQEFSIKLPYPANAKTIYIGGILGNKGVAWFDNFRVTIDGQDIQTLKESERLLLTDIDPTQLKSAISKASFPINTSNAQSIKNSLDALIERAGNKKIVSIGESTHGTSEFYQMRELITKRLVQEKGFKLVLLENPYDDLEVLNNDLYNKPLDSLISQHLFSIYQTKEMRSFLEWYKQNRLNYNVDFKGIDDSYWTFMEVLNASIDTISDKQLNKLKKKLVKDLSKNPTDNFKKECKISSSIYHNILAIEDHLKLTGKLTPEIEEILVNGKNSYISYTYILKNKPIKSRDEIMANRISYLANKRDEQIIVWAHNAHISNQTIIDNEIGVMGRNLKKEFGEDYFSIGLSTLNGSYSYINEKLINADHNYSDKLNEAKLKPSKEVLWESMFALYGSSFYTDMATFKDELKTDKILGPTKLIGYKMESQTDIYYLSIFENFDALIFIKETKPTTPIFE